MYQFEYPWLFVLLPLPLLLWWWLPPYREESPSVRLPFFGEVASAAGLTPATGAVVSRRNRLQWVLAPLAWALVVTALARPQFLEAPIQKVQPARDLLIALDLSQSMDTRDFGDPSGALIPRVQAVRQVVSGFVARRPGDRIGLIVFGDAPYPLAPFTLDHQLVQTLITGLLPGMAGPSTALGDAIGLGIKMFEHSEAPEKVLIVLTDGNDTASRMPPERAGGDRQGAQGGGTYHRHRRSQCFGRGEGRSRRTAAAGRADRGALLLRRRPGRAGDHLRDAGPDHAAQPEDLVMAAAARAVHVAAGGGAGAGAGVPVADARLLGVVVAPAWHGQRS